MSIPAESSGMLTPAGRELVAVTVVAMAEGMAVAVMAVEVMVAAMAVAMAAVAS